MIITSENKQDQIDIQPIGLDRAIEHNLVSIRLSVSGTSADFAGKYSGIHILLSDLEKFINDLTRLEEKRKGEASLVSMSPNDFVLRIVSFDSAGHLGLSMFLRSPRYIFQKPAFQSVEIAFELDAGCFRRILDDFKEMAIQNST